LSKNEDAVDGFGFIDFETPFFVPEQKHIEVSLNSVGCYYKVMVES